MAREFQVKGGIDGSLPFRSESVENYQRLPYMSDDSQIHKGEIGSPYRLYLKRSPGTVGVDDFQSTKSVPHDQWAWMPFAKDACPYTIECVNSLPFKSVGVVYAFVMEDSFLPTHRDWAWGKDTGGYDRTKSLGFSLVPETGGMGTQIWHPGEQKVHEVMGNCTLFDDAMWHGTRIPDKGTRRTIIRIFGELDWDKLADHVVPESVVSL